MSAIGEKGMSYNLFSIYSPLCLYPLLVEEQNIILTDYVFFNDLSTSLWASISD